MHAPLSPGSVLGAPFFVVAAMLLLHGVPVRGFDGDAVTAPPSASTAFTEHPFTLPTAASLLDVLASDFCTRTGEGEESSCTPSVSRLPTHPVLILFTESNAGHSSTLAALRAKVRQIATDVPSSVLRVHEYVIPMSATERRLIELLLIGASHVPTLALFHGRVAKVQVAPGSIVSASPFQTPVLYSTTPLASASYLELRSWALSELPARYVDPVTFHLIPSLQFVFSPAEVHETLQLVRDALEASESRSVLPAFVSMAYMRLTRHGSEEVLAALSSIATQAGNAVLTLVTESAEVAAAWGLRAEHTFTMAPWSSTVAAYLNSSASDGFAASVSDLSPPQSIGTVTELAEATAGSAAWRAACAASVRAEIAQLQNWRQAMNAFNTTSPLRRIDSAAHLLHELKALQNALKIVFVLRESDEMWFHHHLEVAAALARRLQSTTVFYNTTTLAKGSKARSRVERSWTPIMRCDVFWLDAEQLPAVADGLHVSQVPSVLILVPLQSRFGEGGDGDRADAAAAAGDDDQAAAGASEEAGLRRRDPFIGIHTINRYDLLKAAYMDDAQMTHEPVSGKEALPLFPSDSDTLLRFLASGSFLGAMQYTMSSTQLSTLRAKVTELPDAVQAATASGGTSNRHYLQLDRRYYPLRGAEEPMEGPVYVRQILNGSSPLPVLGSDDSDTELGRQPVGGRSGTHPRGTTSASPDEADERLRQRRAREEAAALKRKAAWEANLAKRRREKADRMRRKAAEDAAERERQQEAFQQEVNAALKAEQEGAGGGAGGTWASQPEGLLVRRPTLEDASEGLVEEGRRKGRPQRPFGEEVDSQDAAQILRRRRRLREYREWLADRQLMVNRCVTVTEKGKLSLMTRWE
ncbi:hypothetical protein, unknown function [Leishmania infantum JPCM5]|uniref:Uncharacterized protein n=2 Tax=Leishmania infantum TaxID=5671 RepID=A4HXA9_LEIIN|nr:hypothetical protein, unknown function [Leishmania infantum JPCM5]CAC9477331.1 hypothetical_protein_-_conserved [Leishmania infantum]CAM59728.1 hypothetical protein, unknown function [Leishmania infantum JPCM5]SUZ40787.1 hypothetical_protein_-_conserved [Leishmania infantum]|eukprot:XP_001464700.1 hypothetical protein, unknown function [Leishmania infantum JPCM5]